MIFMTYNQCLTIVTGLGSLYNSIIWEETEGQSIADSIIEQLLFCVNCHDWD